MTTFQFRVTIGENGSIVIPSTPLPPGEEVEVVLHSPETVTEEELKRREIAAERFMELAGCLKDTPGKELISKKQIRSMRLEEKFGDKTLEERQAAGKRFYEMWDGALEGMPDMTMQEIRDERLKKRYGK